jgi:hypothetical protein
LVCWSQYHGRGWNWTSIVKHFVVPSFLLHSGNKFSWKNTPHSPSSSSSSFRTCDAALFLSPLNRALLPSLTRDVAWCGRIILCTLFWTISLAAISQESCLEICLRHATTICVLRIDRMKGFPSYTMAQLTYLHVLLWLGFLHRASSLHGGTCVCLSRSICDIQNRVLNYYSPILILIRKNMRNWTIYKRSNYLNATTWANHYGQILFFIGPCGGSHHFLRLFIGPQGQAPFHAIFTTSSSSTRPSFNTCLSNN